MRSIETELGFAGLYCEDHKLEPTAFLRARLTAEMVMGDRVPPISRNQWRRCLRRTMRVVRRRMGFEPKEVGELFQREERPSEQLETAKIYY